MIATFIPASLKRPARGAPACPVPTMIASYAFDINRSFLKLPPRQFARFPQDFRCCVLDGGTSDNRITETIGKPEAFLSRIELPFGCPFRALSLCVSFPGLKPWAVCCWPFGRLEYA